MSLNLVSIDYLFRDGIFDFLASSRLSSYFDFCCVKLNSANYLFENYFNFKFYFTFLAVRDFLFHVVRRSVRFSVCYYFLLAGLDLVYWDCSSKLMFLNLPYRFLKTKKEYAFFDYFLW
jgi:hypothetical protein